MLTVTTTEKQEVIPSFIDRITDHGSIEFAFWISIILLILVSFWKYFISKEAEKQDWWQLAVEMPIDLCLVVLTLIVTLYIRTNLGGGILFLALTCIVITICCMLRRHALKTFTPTNKKILTTSFFCTCFTIIIAVAFTIWIYYVIV